MNDSVEEKFLSLEEYHRICQFYYTEARLLDERKYQQWLGLLTENVAYVMPARHVPILDPALRETEALLDISQDTSHGLQAPLRDDNYFTLSIRVMRSFKMNSWTDNPPPRTTRLVSNIEAQYAPEGVETYSNVAIAYSRSGRDNVIYTARRQDMLRITENGIKIARRKVMLDWNIIEAPSIGLFF